MRALWVANASPIICLAKAGLLDLLIRLPEKLVIPEDVAAEIEAGPIDDPTSAILQSNRMTLVTVEPAHEISAWDLGKGETAVITYALENPGWIAIIDDRAARKCAMSFSIPVKGTLAVILIAKKRGLISSVGEAIERLRSAGLRVDEKIVEEALKQSNELR